MKLSIVIPAHNEEGCIETTVVNLNDKLVSEQIEHEILVVNDHSSDETENILKRLSADIPSLRYVNNEGLGGFGLAIRKGLENFSGDCVAVYMADASDRPEDLVNYYRTMIKDGVDCVFGTRFHKDSNVYDYPKFKLFVNRMANLFISFVFGFRYNDTTNAFKLYGRNMIEGSKPFLSNHFNLTVELPLKGIVRGYTFSVVPNDWINRSVGESKLNIKEMGSRYLFIVLYCLIEKWLSRGDYHQEATVVSNHRKASNGAN
jgi:dolichol-phosphate mannosyltransferase